MAMLESELDIVRRHMNAEPVNVAAIFSDLGVAYNERKILTGESGWIECNDGDFRVVVNSQESEQRRRFTAAHELGHYLLHRDLLYVAGKANRHTDRLFGAAKQNNRETPFNHAHEVQANKIAAQVVMPASRIKEAWKAMTGAAHFKTEQIAKQFGVSNAAMRIRLKTLGFDV